MEYKSESTGARIIINPCSFVEALKLKSTIQKALLGMGKNLEELLNEDLATLLFSIDSSEEVVDCLFECLKRSTYNSNAIKPDVFDDLKAREDLYGIFYNCIKVNLHPFFKKILSELGINIPLDKLKGALTQKLTMSSDSSVALSQGKGISEETQSV